MRKLTWIAIVGAALAGTGLAVAHGFDSKSVTPVSVTFSATPSGTVSTTTCTGSNGHTYATAKATYTGTPTTSSDPNLNNQTITLEVRSLIDTTASPNVGIVSGKLQIGSGSNETDAHFDSVYSNGNIAGYAQGHTGTPHTELQGNLSAAFSTATGFTGGKLGGGTSGGNAVELGPGGCQGSNGQDHGHGQDDS